MTKRLSRVISNTIIFSMLVCFLGKTASAQIKNYDETYYSPSKNELVVEKYEPLVMYKDTTIGKVQEEIVLELEGTPLNVETKAKTVVVYDESDYYDYAYTARIRRFDSPVVGIGYYDDYYTNMYWYTYNPNYWGVSIYLGYNWWYPSWSWYYRPYYYSHWGYYDPFYNPYWNPYWDPFYYGHHHHHHHHGHHHHYHGHHHHYAWNCNHYYNSFDRGSFYYGPRTYNGATSRYIGGRTQNIASRNSTRYAGDNRTFGQRYESAIASRTSTSRNNTANVNTPTRRGGVDINRNADRSSSTSERNNVGSATGERVSTTSGRGTTSTTTSRGTATTNTSNRGTSTTTNRGTTTTTTNDRGTSTTTSRGTTTTSTNNRGTSTTGSVSTSTNGRSTSTGTGRQVSGSDKYSKPSSVTTTRDEQYTRPTSRTSTSTNRVSSGSSSNSNNSSSSVKGTGTRSSNTTSTIQRKSNNTSTNVNRSSSSSRSSSVRSSSSSSRSSSGSSVRSTSTSSSRSSSGSSSRGARR